MRNFLVELLLGLAFIVILGHTLAYDRLILVGVFWVTVVIAVMDWETKLVSEALVVFWAVLVTLANWANWANWSGVIMGIGVIGGIWGITRGKAMGFGDVEIAAVMGWWLGWPGIAPALWIAFVSGAVVGSGLWVVGRKKMKSEIAFGPFLILGSWIAYIWGERLWSLIF